MSAKQTYMDAAAAPPLLPSPPKPSSQTPSPHCSSSAGSFGGRQPPAPPITEVKELAQPFNNSGSTATGTNGPAECLTDGTGDSINTVSRSNANNESDRALLLSLGDRQSLNVKETPPADKMANSTIVLNEAHTPPYSPSSPSRPAPPEIFLAHSHSQRRETPQLPNSPLVRFVPNSPTPPVQSPSMNEKRHAAAPLSCSTSTTSSCFGGGNDDSDDDRELSDTHSDRHCGTGVPRTQRPSVGLRPPKVIRSGNGVTNAQGRVLDILPAAVDGSSLNVAAPSGELLFTTTTENRQTPQVQPPPPRVPVSQLLGCSPGDPAAGGGDLTAATLAEATAWNLNTSSTASARVMRWVPPPPPIHGYAGFTESPLPGSASASARGGNSHSSSRLELDDTCANSHRSGNGFGTGDTQPPLDSSSGRHVRIAVVNSPSSEPPDSFRKQNTSFGMQTSEAWARMLTRSAALGGATAPPAAVAFPTNSNNVSLRSSPSRSNNTSMRAAVSAGGVVTRTPSPAPAAAPRLPPRMESFEFVPRRPKRGGRRLASESASVSRSSTAPAPLSASTGTLQTVFGPVESSGAGRGFRPVAGTGVPTARASALGGGNSSSKPWRFTIVYDNDEPPMVENRPSTAPTDLRPAHGEANSSGQSTRIPISRHVAPALAPAKSMGALPALGPWRQPPGVMSALMMDLHAGRPLPDLNALSVHANSTNESSIRSRGDNIW